MTDKNSKIEPRLLKGFTDFLPKEARARQILFRTIEQVFERFGFEPMSTPAIEYKEILLNKYGDDEKLVYTFKDHGERDVALRYDLTVPLARFFAQHQNELVVPFKRYQIAPVWRAENTQRGRLREFYQCDIDIVGTESLLSDAEIIACLCAVYEAVGIDNYQVRINDRGIFNIISEKLGLSMEESVHVLRAIDKFYKIGSKGVLLELEGFGFSSEHLKFIEKYLSAGTNTQALKFLQELLPDHNVTAQVEQLFDLVKNLGVHAGKLVFDPLIARGLDYYTGMVFEVTLIGDTVGSIGAGGRYNSLLNQFSKNPSPAVGGSIGIDRILDALGYEFLTKSAKRLCVLVFNIEKELFSSYLRMLTQLRKAGVSAELYYEPSKMDKQFKYAEQKQFTHALMYGSKEHAEGLVQIKDLETREQRSAKEEDIVRIMLEDEWKG